MIYGIGTDIIKVSRIEASLERFGTRLVQKILSEREQEVFEQRKAKVQYLAKVYAAKEAAAKAFGTGFTQGLGFNQISVLRSGGKPTLHFERRAAEMIEERSISRTSVSLSDEVEFATAFVIFEVDLL